MIGTQEIGFTGSRSKKENSSFYNSFHFVLVRTKQITKPFWRIELIVWLMRTLTIVTGMGELDNQHRGRQDKLYQVGIHRDRDLGR